MTVGDLLSGPSLMVALIVGAVAIFWSSERKNNDDVSTRCAPVPEGALIETLELSGSPAAAACFLVLRSDAVVEVQCHPFRECRR